MILQPRECVICETIEQQRQLASILDENGYLMIEKFGSITGHVNDGQEPCGYRWVVGGKFPHCVAKLSQDHIRDVVELGNLFDSHGRNPHTWVSYETFLLRLEGNNVEVGDLL